MQALYHTLTSEDAEAIDYIQIEGLRSWQVLLQGCCLGVGDYGNHGLCMRQVDKVGGADLELPVLQGLDAPPLCLAEHLQHACMPQLVSIRSLNAAHDRSRRGALGGCTRG